MTMQTADSIQEVGDNASRKTASARLAITNNILYVANDLIKDSWKVHYNLHMNAQQNTPKKQDTGLELTKQRLYQFSQTPQAQFSRQALEGSATSATLICAFFMGAAKAFASDNETLQLIIAKLIDMDDRGTQNLIDTTQRLGNKYPFVKDVIMFGQQTADTWQARDSHMLAQLLKQNQNQSLMEMVKKGTIEGDSAPAKVRASVNQAVETNPRLKRLLLILLVLIILVTANYLTLTMLAK